MSLVIFLFIEPQASKFSHRMQLIKRMLYLAKDISQLFIIDSPTENKEETL